MPGSKKAYCGFSRSALLQISFSVNSFGYGANVEYILKLLAGIARFIIEEVAFRVSRLFI